MTVPRLSTELSAERCTECERPLEMFGYQAEDRAMICGSCYATRMGYCHV